VSIPVLTWKRRKYSGDLRAPDGGSGVYRIVASGAGFELWFTDRSIHEYLGWFADEDEAQKTARDHVGDAE
jgi:hypothetical protein